MADRKKSTLPVPFVARETRVAAHNLRAMSAHLFALATIVPRPSPHVQALVYESGSDEALARYPGLDLASTLEATSDSLDELIRYLDETAARLVDGGTGAKTNP